MKVMTHGWPSGEEVSMGIKEDQSGWLTVLKEGSPSGAESDRQGIRAPHHGSCTSTQSAGVVSSKEMSL
jgi:hypothetical protein